MVAKERKKYKKRLAISSACKCRHALEEKLPFKMAGQPGEASKHYGHQFGRHLYGARCKLQCREPCRPVKRAQRRECPRRRAHDFAVFERNKIALSKAAMAYISVFQSRHHRGGARAWRSDGIVAARTARRRHTERRSVAGNLEKRLARSKRYYVYSVGR